MIRMYYIKKNEILEELKIQRGVLKISSNNLNIGMIIMRFASFMTFTLFSIIFSSYYKKYKLKYDECIAQIKNLDAQIKKLENLKNKKI